MYFSKGLSTFPFLKAYILGVALSSTAIPILGGVYYIKYDWLAAFAFSVFGFVYIALKHRGMRKLPLVYVLIAVFYMLINGLLAFAFSSQQLSLRAYMSSFLQYSVAFVTFIIFVCLRIRTKDVFRFMNVWVFIACCACILSIVQVVLDDLIVDRFIFIPYYEGSEISNKVIGEILAPTAWFSESSWLGSFLIVPAFYSLLSMVHNDLSRRDRTLHWISAALLIIGIVLSYSIGTVVSAAVGLVFLIARSGRTRWTMIGFAFVFGLLGYLFYEEFPRLSLLVARIGEAINNTIDYQTGSEYYGRLTSFYVRSIGFTEGFSDFMKSPVVGIGLGQATMFYHSGFITLLAEQGLLGLTVYYSLPLYMIWKLNVSGRQWTGNERFLANFFVTALIVDFTNGLIVHNPFHLQRWLLISVAVSWWLTMPERKSSARRAFVGLESSEQRPQ